MTRRIRTAASSLLLLLFCGCWWLPEGDPPPGNILNNPGSGGDFSVRTMSAATEYFTSALALVLMERCPGEAVRLEADDPSRQPALRALLDAGSISGNPPGDERAAWVLVSSVDDRIFRMRLVRGGETVWSDQVALAPPDQTSP